MFLLLIIADLLMVIAFILRFSSLPPQIPFFYSRPWGEDQLADYGYIFLLPILMHIFFFFNIYIYHRYFIADSVILRMIKILNYFLVIILTGVFLKIVFMTT